MLLSVAACRLSPLPGTVRAHLLKKIFEKLQPLLDKIEEIVAATTDTVTEVLCCGSSPHPQGALKAVSDIVDCATCWVDPAMDGMTDFLVNLLPEIELQPFDEVKIAAFDLPVQLACLASERKDDPLSKPKSSFRLRR